MPFYYYSREDKKLIVKKTEMLFVAEFAQLQQQFGWNALQYLILFSSAASPFFQDKSNERDRHDAIVDTIRQMPWDAGGKKIAKQFYEDPLFRIASKKYIVDFDDQLELRQESALRKSREIYLRDIEKYVGKAELTDEEKTKMEKAGDGLVKMTKLHETVKELAKNRVDSDDSPAIIFGEVAGLDS